MNLQALIDQTMVGHAAKCSKLPLVPLSAAYRSEEPNPQTAEDWGGDLSEAIVRENFIWRLSWDPSNPGAFTDVTIASRGMGMDYGMPAKAFNTIEFRRVQVTRDNGQLVDLYLDQAHMIGAWRTHAGEIPESDRGLWRLGAKLDESILVMFGYTLDGEKPSPLDRAACDELDEALIPRPGASHPGVELVAAAGATVWVCVGEARYIVAVELCLHREHNNFVPGGFIGFARIHPHVMVWSNEDLRDVQASIVLDRPAKGMSHGAMKAEHGLLVVTDTNVAHDPSAKIQMPIPYSDLLYDYYETHPYSAFRRRTKRAGDHPLTEKGEITLADPRFKRGRILEGKIKRNTPLLGKADPEIFKEPRQGQFDNVHIAPRMRLEYEDFDGSKLVFDDIVMLNTCLHDCTHMHVRWSAFLTDKIIAGWKNGEPHVEPGAPGVPENQVVFVSFPSVHAMKYRAVATKVPAGELVVIMHHGLAYAVDEWPTAEAAMALKMMRGGIEQLANQFNEPACKLDPNDKWASFYFRVRYTGYGTWVQQRSEFEIEECMP